MVLSLGGCEMWGCRQGISSKLSHFYQKLGSRAGPEKVQRGSREGKNIPNWWDAPLLGSEPLLGRTQ